MEITSQIASDLGFPRQEYTLIERERRWLCLEVPQTNILRSEVITDSYIKGSRLRLREIRPVGGTPVFKLTRKADAAPDTRLCTTISLPESEYTTLLSALPGFQIKKLRYRLSPLPGSILTSIDMFQDKLDGLRIVEAEFKSDENMAEFAPPTFVASEITHDPRYTGGSLAQDGLP